MKRLSQNLISLIIVLFVISFFIFYKSTNNKQIIPQKKLSIQNKTKNSEHEKLNKIEINTASFEQLCKIGFTAKQARNCINYRKAGHYFTTTRDLLKLYSITESDFNKLAPYIYVYNPKNKQSQIKQNQKTQEQKKYFELIEINTCDTNQLQKIPKIGSYRAKKIVEYRNKLGGFFTLNQLSTIYSIDSSVVNEIRKRCSVSPQLIEKININTATWKELNSHPLISSYQTKNILEYKKIVGTIKNVDELRDNNIITKEEFEILKFYIKTF